MKNFDLLYKKAFDLVLPRKLSEAAECGGVAVALLTSNGNIYTGICIHCACGIGFCAEHAAVAEMLKHNESEISELVAVTENGRIMSPCGRCRELLVQVNPNNKKTIVYLSKNETRNIAELLPNPTY